MKYTSRDHSETDQLIARRSLRRVFKKLKEISAECSSEVKAEISAAESTYRYLLHYLAEGYADPSREDQLQSLRYSLRRVNDRIFVEANMADSTLDWFATLRLSLMNGRSLKEMVEKYMAVAEPLRDLYSLGVRNDDSERMQTQADNLLADIFDKVNVSYRLSGEDRKFMGEVMSDPESPVHLKRHLLSATVMSIMRFYDDMKLDFMADIAESEDAGEEMRAIALTGIILTFSRHPLEAAAFGNIKLRIELWKDNDRMAADLRKVASELIRTIDTDTVRRKMNEEVIPKLMKLGPDIVKRMRDASADSDVGAIEDNPEWAGLMEQSGLREKLEELSEMQSEGADLMMAAFSNLKSFPFFRRAANWFLAFDSNHSALGAFRRLQTPVFDSIFATDMVMCDSDKYSFALSLDRMPESRLNMMTASLSQQFDQLRMAQEGSVPTSADADVVVHARRFIRGLYRYEKLFKDNGKDLDCFENAIVFTELGALWKAIESKDAARLAGEFYFSRKIFSAALALLSAAAADTEKLLLEQIGYCHEHLGNQDMAVESYTRALLIDPKSVWLRKRLAHCYLSGPAADYAKAEEIYMSLLGQDPENEKLMMLAAKACIYNSDYKKALGILYKLNYLYPDNRQADRLAARCEMMTGDFEKSRGIYARLLLTDPVADDYFNIGKLSLLENKIKESAGYFKEGVRAGGAAGLKKALDQDMHFLENHGISRQVILLLTDKLLYDLEE